MIPSDQNISSPRLISAILQYGCLSFCIVSESWTTNCYGFSFLQIHWWCLLYMVLLVFILHLSQSTLKSVVPLAMLLSSIWRHDNSGWGKCWFLPCLWFGRPGPPFSRADHYIMYIVQNHILSIIIHCTKSYIVYHYTLYIVQNHILSIYYTLYIVQNHILSVVWTPWPTATHSMGLWHRGERALLCRFRYRTFLACRPLYLVHTYTIYILSGRFDISHLFCAPLIMQDTKALAVCRYHWYAYLSYQIRILYQWYANISHRNTQLHWSGKSW